VERSSGSGYPISCVNRHKSAWILDNAWTGGEGVFSGAKVRVFLSQRCGAAKCAAKKLFCPAKVVFPAKLKHPTKLSGLV
jgi:hypothetical protein